LPRETKSLADINAGECLASTRGSTERNLAALEHLSPLTMIEIGERLKPLAAWIELVYDACHKRETAAEERERFLKARKLQRQKVSATNKAERENIKERFHELYDHETPFNRVMRTRFPRDEDAD
jgi:hypothetical protein